MKGAKSNNMWFIALALFVVLFFTGALNQFGLSPPSGAQSVSPVVGQPSQASLTGPEKTVAACQLGGLKTATLGVAVQDVGAELKASTTRYSSPSYAIVREDGTVVTTATATAGSSLTYDTSDVSCSRENLAGKIYVLGTAAAQSAVIDFSFNGETQKDYVLRAYNSSVLAMTILNSDTGANVSETQDTLNSANETAATTMGQGDTRTRVLKFSLNSGTNAFGSPVGPVLSSGRKAGVLISIDNTDSQSFDKNDISLSVLASPGGWFIESVDCSRFGRATSAHNSDRCYLAPAMTETGNYKMEVSMTASKGNPATSADPRVYFDDIVCFEELGKVACDTHDISNTNRGVALSQQFGFDNS